MLVSLTLSVLFCFLLQSFLYSSNLFIPVVTFHGLMVIAITGSQTYLFTYRRVRSLLIVSSFSFWKFLIISLTTGGCKPEKDPAEMTVQERLAIFSKKQTSALVPKAPFGQSVPVKVSMDSFLVLHCKINSCIMVHFIKRLKF